MFLTLRTVSWPHHFSSGFYWAVPQRGCTDVQCIHGTLHEGAQCRPGNNGSLAGTLPLVRTSSTKRVMFYSCQEGISKSFLAADYHKLILRRLQNQTGTFLFRLRYFGLPLWKEIQQNSDVQWKIYNRLIAKRKVWYLNILCWVKLTLLIFTTHSSWEVWFWGCCELICFRMCESQLLHGGRFLSRILWWISTETASVQ